MSHLDQNRRAWDSFVRQQQRHTKPARDEDLSNALQTIQSDAWIGRVAGLQVLCLAAGGGRQSALYAAAGALVTVVDLSPEMLALDRQVATERQLNINAIETSMDDLSAIGTAQFDLVVQPVSTCYVPDIGKVYREVARVTRSGGVYISQHKQPVSLQADNRAAAQGYELIEPYYRSGALPPVIGCQHREQGTLEYLHRWEELVGHLCRSGFVIEDLSEPLHAKPDAAVGTFAHRSQFVPPYVRIKARRVGNPSETEARSAKLWTPEV